MKTVTRRRSGSRPRWAPRAEWFARRRVSNRRDRYRWVRVVAGFRGSGKTANDPPWAGVVDPP